MTVLCIVSGENMPAAGGGGGGGGAGGESRVDFRRLVQRARELGLGNRGGAGGATGRRIDSGVAMGSSFDSDDMYGNGDGEEVSVHGHRHGARLTSVGA